MESSELCTFLEWDTDFFDHRIARVVGSRADGQRMESILEWCRERAIECLYFLADADDPATVRAAEDYQFRFVDVRVTLARGIQGWRVPGPRATPAGISIRGWRPEDVPALLKIAEVSHADSRFFFDRCFSNESCRALYATWIRRSCEGWADMVLVAENKDGKPVGYTTCHLLRDDPPHGEIGLVGVAEEARGGGVGRLLIEAALDWFSLKKVQEVSVVTQGRNGGAQRLYQRCGFLTQSMQLWYHKWMPECAPEERS
jgi:dTDP-4-amino-4,6-dideoxy-D-galactose acyltransferase